MASAKSRAWGEDGDLMEGILQPLLVLMLRDSTLRRNMVEEQGIRTQETYISD